MFTRNNSKNTDINTDELLVCIIKLTNKIQLLEAQLKQLYRANYNHLHNSNIEDINT